MIFRSATHESRHSAYKKDVNETKSTTLSQNASIEDIMGSTQSDTKEPRGEHEKIPWKVTRQLLTAKHSNEARVLSKNLAQRKGSIQLLTQTGGREPLGKKSCVSPKNSTIAPLGTKVLAGDPKQRGVRKNVGELTSTEVNRKEVMAVDRSRTLGQTSGIESHITSSSLFSVACASLASFQFGYNSGCVNAPSALITDWIIASHQRLFNTVLDKSSADFTWSMVVSIFGIGAVVGGLLSSMLADKAGRRGGLFYTNIVAFFAAALMGLAKTLDVYPMILFGRFFIGINVGLAVMVPMYLTEIAPTNLRGTFGSFHQLSITFSILVSQVFGLPQFFGTADRWPYIFAFVAVPALLQVIALPMIPESPKFTLCIRGEVERAIQDLELLRGTGNAWLEVQQMREEAIRTTNDIPSMLDMFRGSLLWPSTLTVVMMIAQQLTGINAAIFYSTIIFEQIGFKEDSVYATLAMGLINFLTTIPANILVDHPRFGRRVLLLVGVVGMMISSIFLVVFISLSKTGVVWASYFAAVSVVLFVMFFAAGPGSIPWFFPSEIVFTNARANACALTAVANWVTNFFVSSTFVIVHNAIHQFSFLLFFFFLTLYLVFVWKCVPETNRRTIEEIATGFEKKE